VTGARRLVRVLTPSEAEGVLSALAAEGVALRHFSVGVNATQAVFAPDDVPDLGRVLGAIRERAPHSVADETGAVTVVGAGTGSSARTLEMALAAIRELGVVPESIDATPMRFTLYLNGASVDDATRALHRALIES
jgi:aspartokinase